MKKTDTVMAVLIFTLSVYAALGVFQTEVPAAVSGNPLSETRETERIIEGEVETVTETLYHSDWDFSFWYDDETFLIERTESEYGDGVSVSPVVTDYPVYLEIYPPETAGVLPWKYLELNAREGDEYNYDILENGTRIIWFERSEYGYLYGYYAIETDKSFAIAFLECAEEVAEGYGARLKDVLWTISFGEDILSEPEGEELDDRPEKTVPVKLRWVYGETVDVSLDQPSEWTLPGEEFPAVEFSADKTVSQFKIMSLTFEDIDDDGNLKFQEETVYEQPLLEAGKTLTAEINFMGSIPNYGISFMDESGVIYKYLISESGKDGSLYLADW